MILLQLLSVSLASALANRTLQVIVVHPKPDGCSTETSQRLSQCSEVLSVEEDILSAANRTANEINSCSEFLNGFTVQVESVSSYFPYSVVDLARVLRSPSVNTTVVGLVGLVGQSFARNILPLPSDLRIIQIIQPALGLRLDHTKHYPHLYTTAPSMDQHIAAVTEILLALGWTRLGLIYSREVPVYARAAERFITLNNCSDKPITVTEFPFTEHTLSELKTNSQTNFFFLILPLTNLSWVLCKMHYEGLTWPKYRWIILSDDSMKFELHSCYSGLSLIEAMDNAIIVKSSLRHSLNATVRSACRNSNDDGFTSDSMWALALALNFSTPLPASIDSQTILSIQSYLTSFSVVDSPFEKALTSVSQVQAGVVQTIGYFNYAMSKLNIDFDSLGPVPTISPSQAYDYDIFTPLMTWLLVAAVTLCILFTIILLALFVYFRKEPEVKASSVSLSLCMFPGFYLLQLASLSHFVNSGRVVVPIPERYFSCCFTTYCAILGIDIVLAALLMKLLRVWRIFMIFGKTGKLWTDYMMLVFIAGIVLIKVLILIIWAAVDAHFLADVLKTTPSGVEVIAQQCVSNNTALWSIVAYGYSGFLGVCLIGAAIKTRKIKHSDFKDTKKICILVCILIYIGIVGGTLWGVLRIAGDSTGSKVIIGITYCAVSVLCLAILFVPKIVSPLKRRAGAKASDGKELRRQSTKTSLFSTG